ncbi:MAG: glutamate-1-semialdehyde 2,1-aminomutase [Actinomycetaceae bacterium]|nr:glutamate-1-semialdehyde 2,1-aminomutase [Actinomycetaceae bacterium]
MTSNKELFEQAQKVIPGGVDSPVRAFGSVGGTPAFIERGEGPWIYDAEGTKRVDLVCSWGPLLLGHCDARVLDAVNEAAGRGLSFGAPTETETLLAQEIRRRIPAAEKIRLVSTGTEATMTAIRLARGATNRSLLIKFAGCYHGHSDGLLAEAGSGVATGGLPASAGVPAEISGQTIVLPYNDEQALRECFAERGKQIAGVIVEGAAANMGVVPPTPGFYTAIRELCDEYGALMIMDEVLTGFRCSASGWWGLHTGLADTAGSTNEGTLGVPEREAYTPDLFCFGKVVGGGMPLAGLGGRAEIMDLLAPLGPVYQAGTLSGNPVSTAAGLATLRGADENVYRHISRVSGEISTAFESEFARVGLPVQVQRAGSLFSFFFSENPVINYEQAKACETFRYTPMFWSLFEAGVYTPPSVFEAWFVSSAHDERAVNRVLDAIPAAVRAATDARP